MSENWNYWAVAPILVLFLGAGARVERIEVSCHEYNVLVECAISDNHFLLSAGLDGLGWGPCCCLRGDLG